MQTVYFYTKDHCPLCDEAEALLNLLQHEYSFHVEKRDIYTHDEWLEKYHLIIPVVVLNGEELNSNSMNYESLDAFLKKHLKHHS